MGFQPVGEPVLKTWCYVRKSYFSIGAVKGVEFGNGFQASLLSGSENNDGYAYDKNNNLTKLSNNAGGIVGGISDGFLAIIRPFKPTPSIHKTHIANKNGENIELQVEGRHDLLLFLGQLL